MGGEKRDVSLLKFSCFTGETGNPKDIYLPIEKYCGNCKSARVGLRSFRLGPLPSPELAIASKLFRTILKLLFEEVVIEILVIPEKQEIQKIFIYL